MTNKTFSNITTEECLQAYFEIMRNAEVKWNSANILAESNDFGSAASLAVVSTEETIKALVLYIDSLGFNFRRIKGMDVLFNQHRLRYFLAYIVFAVSLFGDDLKKFVLSVRDNPEKMKIYMDEMSANMDTFLRKRLKIYALRKLIQFHRELKWFSKMDIFRQEGFYCDYEDQLKSPISITKTNYKELIDRLGKVRDSVNSFILALQFDNMNEPITNLKIDFVKLGYYQNIASSIKNMKMKRTDPFVWITKNIK